MNEIVVIENDEIEIISIGIQGPPGPPGPGSASNYGVFSSNQDQTAAVNTPTAMTLNTTAEAVGVSISGSQIIFAASGTYDLQFSAQVHHRGGGGNGLELYIWFRLNGSSIANSATKLIIQKNDYLVPAWDFMLTVAAGDVMEIMWQVDNVDIVLEHVDASGARPAIPSLIVTVMQVR